MSHRQSQTNQGEEAKKSTAHQLEEQADQKRSIPSVEYREGRSALVIGMGLFGSAVALELTKLGWFVLAVDGEAEKLNAISQHVSSVRVINAIDYEVIRSLEPGQFDLCLSAIGDENGHVISTTIHNLSRSGARFIVARSINSEHNKMFERLGCHLIVEPEQHFGVQLSALFHGLADLSSLDLKKYKLLDKEDLQKRSLEISQDKPESSEGSWRDGGSVTLHRGLQLLIWLILLRYAYRLSATLDEISLNTGGQSSIVGKGSESEQFFILASILMVAWVFLGQWVKPKNP